MRPHHDLQAAARRQAATDPDWQAHYRRSRPPVERAVAWLVHHGNRRLRYRGTIVNNAWFSHPSRRPQPPPTDQPRTHPHWRRLTTRPGQPIANRGRPAYGRTAPTKIFMSLLDPRRPRAPSGLPRAGPP
ncbi:transposase [Streptomyces griseofuscus]|uniref:transposase n=1 Tax=Streptomyces griseofuscus TaxID=146922 RepID=UPI0037F99C58